jgi:hypothetical protein
MNPAQANALLLLIADLARIVYNPPPAEAPPMPEASNGVVKEPAGAAHD